jgi:hypothetical protein
MRVLAKLLSPRLPTSLRLRHHQARGKRCVVESRPATAVAAGTLLPRGLAQLAVVGLALLATVYPASSQTTFCQLADYRSYCPAALQLKVIGHWGHNPNANLADVSIDGHYAYIGHFVGDEGVTIIDLSDPANIGTITNPPVYIPTPGPRGTSITCASGEKKCFNFEYLQVRDGVGFFPSTNGGGIFIVNLHDPKNPRLYSQINTQWLGANAVDRFHHVSLDGNYLFAGSSFHQKIFVYDVSNPARPKFVRVLNFGDSPVYNLAKNGFLYVSFIGGTTQIYKLSDLESATSMAPQPIKSFRSDPKTHQSWPLMSNYLAIAHEHHFTQQPPGDGSAGEVSLWDIGGVGQSNARKISTIKFPTNPLEQPSAHTVAIVGNMLYASWYEAGLRAYDVTDPRSPSLVGWYQTGKLANPGYVTGESIGAFAVYPFSDGIAVIDTVTGLWLLAPPESNTEPPDKVKITYAGLKDTPASSAWLTVFATSTYPPPALLERSKLRYLGCDDIRWEQLSIQQTGFKLMSQ